MNLLVIRCAQCNIQSHLLRTVFTIFPILLSFLVWIRRWIQSWYSLDILLAVSLSIGDYLWCKAPNQFDKSLLNLVKIMEVSWKGGKCILKCWSTEIFVSTVNWAQEMAVPLQNGIKILAFRVLQTLSIFQFSMSLIDYRQIRQIWQIELRDNLNNSFKDNAHIHRLKMITCQKCASHTRSVNACDVCFSILQVRLFFRFISHLTKRFPL